MKRLGVSDFEVDGSVLSKKLGIGVDGTERLGVDFLAALVVLKIELLAGMNGFEVGAPNPVKGLDASWICEAGARVSALVNADVCGNPEGGVGLPNAEMG